MQRLALFFMMISLSACGETIDGFGRDMSHAGNTISGWISGDDTDSSNQQEEYHQRRPVN